MMGPHKNLLVWAKSIEFTTEIYRFTASFPSFETFALADQMRRAAVSISSNIAEGYGRNSQSELIRFLYYSLGSSNELDTQILIAKNLGYLSQEQFETLDLMNEEINKMLRSLIRKRENTVY